MAAKRGSTLLIKRGDGATPTEAFTTVGALRNGNITFDGNPIDVTTADDVDGNNEIWSSFITGVKSLSISGDGVAKAIEPIQSIYEDFAQGTIGNYEIVVPFVGTWTVPFVITNISFEGPYDGALTFSLSAQSAGAPTFVAET